MWILILYIFDRGPQLHSIEFSNQTSCMNAKYDIKQALKSPPIRVTATAICVKK